MQHRNIFGPARSLRRARLPWNSGFLPPFCSIAFTAWDEIGPIGPRRRRKRAHLPLLTPQRRLRSAGDTATYTP
jgi:hypothetical protein